jgi:shikimate dehydrogenase
VLLGVAGRPEVVANSLSPRMMQSVFDAWGWSHAQYRPLPMQEDEAADQLRALADQGFTGCNVTMPYKSVAASIADTSSAAVQQAGVANTLCFRPDGSIHADATDGVALTRALAARSVELTGGRAVLLGAGGVAMEAALALIDGGITRIDIWNRTPERAVALAERLRIIAPALELEVHGSMPIRDPALVIVGCVPADAIDPEALADVHEGSLLVDYAYRRDGGVTPVIGAARTGAQPPIDGRELLVRQGAAALEVWFDAAPPIEVMTRAVR